MSNEQVIEEFRANRGRVGGAYERARLLLLTTTGARTGTPHTVPLRYLPDGGRRLVIASAEGGAAHPDWYHNLVANSQVTVETGVMAFEAKASVLSGDERDSLFARAVEADPHWAEEAARTRRTLPVIALEQVPGPPQIDALPGDALKLVHDLFRRELALVRAEVAESGASLGAQLRVNCLTVCNNLHLHHETEDGHIFPGVEERTPELASVVAQLREQHKAIRVIVDELQAVLSRPAASPAALLAEVDRLIADLDAHLTNEEQYLVPALNATAA